MSITSLWFALFAGTLIWVYYRVPGKWQWAVLLAASYGFYLWAGIRYFFFLLFTTLSTYLTTVTMANNLAACPPPEARRRNKGCLWLCLGANFGILLLCKLCLTERVSQAVGNTPISFLTLGLPMGISFFMFQSMGYVLDVYRGKAAALHNPLHLALFVGYFPQLIQGPISKFSQLSPQLLSPHRFDKKQVSFGMERMLWGYFKKLVLADRIAPWAAALRSAEGNGAAFWLLAFVYALQIYADFTGGIDITLGFSQMLGISLTENFQRPFFAKNTAEFWRRWHISLGAWMREYIFYPVCVSRPCLELGRYTRKHWGSFGKRFPVYIATTATWLTTGLWHGLTPNFILWGMLNCTVIVVSEELEPMYRRFHARLSWKEKPWYRIFQMLRTFCLMNLIRLCDLYPDVREYFQAMAAPWCRVEIPGATVPDGILLILGTGVLLAVSLYQEKWGCLREALWKRPVLRQWVFSALFLAVLLLGCYGVEHEASSFIYNQF